MNDDLIARLRTPLIGSPGPVGESLIAEAADALEAQAAVIAQALALAADAWDEGWEARDRDEFGGSLTVQQRANPYRNEVRE